jgi:formiminoglutamate deiminase
VTGTTYWCELALLEDRVESDVALTVDDGRFMSIEAAVPAPPDAIRLPGLTIPGLANAHSHAFHRALRGRTQTGTGSFWTWRDVMYRATERLDPDRYHRLARATFAEMALAGITVVGEFHYLHHQPDGTPYANLNAMGEALLAAAGEAGIRITLLDTLYLHGGLTADGYMPTEGTQRRYDDGDSASWVQRVDRLSSSPTQRIGAAIHSVRAVDPDAMRVVAAWADERDAPLHAHVSEQQAENAQCLAHHGVSPTGLLRGVGVLGRRFTAVHATHLSYDEVATYAAARASVCLCPTTERDLGDGIGPTSPLAEAGVVMTLGSDSHAVIDLLEEARAVELDERLRAERRGIHSAADLLAMATVNGHARLGWDDAGMISSGCRADLVTISLDSVRTAGATADTAIETAVFAASAADITHVVVDGIAVVTDGRHTTIDVTGELRASIEDVMDV